MPVGNYGHLSHSVRKRLPIFAAQKSSTGRERDDCGFRCIRRLGRICTPRYRVQQLREAVSTTGAEYSHLDCVRQQGLVFALGRTSRDSTLNVHFAGAEVREAVLRPLSAVPSEASAVALQALWATPASLCAA